MQIISQRKLKMFQYLFQRQHRKKELTCYYIVMTMGIINQIQFKSKCQGHITTGFPYYLWFNRFPIQQNANWYILVGIYAKHPDNELNANAKTELVKKYTDEAKLRYRNRYL